MANDCESGERTMDGYYYPNENPQRSQAIALWRDGGERAVFQWCGVMLRKSDPSWLDACEAWLKAGLVVDLAFCERVTALAWRPYEANGRKGVRTLAQWLRTANELLIQPPPGTTSAADHRDEPDPARGAQAVSDADIDAAYREGPGTAAWRKLPDLARRVLQRVYHAQASEQGRDARECAEQPAGALTTTAPTWKGDSLGS